jgi:hypothetical protein
LEGGGEVEIDDVEVVNIVGDLILEGGGDVGDGAEGEVVSGAKDGDAAGVGLIGVRCAVGEDDGGWAERAGGGENILLCSKDDEAEDGSFASVANAAKGVGHCPA